ncbi:MAG: hypothetical protein ACJAZO_003952 [Myxococcota bacterium]|jgi:hypothetical protein
MVANLSLSRSSWESHDNYPQHVLLLGAHRSFRDLSSQLVRRALEGAGPRELLPTFSWWKSGMHSHERYEEHKLYPYLQHRWGLDCTHLTEGHEALARGDAEVRSTTGAAFATALANHDAVLKEHLDAEERLVIPALLALTRSEFLDYCDNPLFWLLRRVPCRAGDVGCTACLRP